MLESCFGDRALSAGSVCHLDTLYVIQPSKVRNCIFFSFCLVFWDWAPLWHDVTAFQQSNSVHFHAPLLERTTQRSQFSWIQPCIYRYVNWTVLSVEGNVHGRKYRIGYKYRHGYIRGSLWIIYKALPPAYFHGNGRK